MDWRRPLCACVEVLLCLLTSVCVCVCEPDLGSGPGTWPRCVPASDRTPPSPGRGCHRNGRLRHTPGWSWCASSRCCKHTCGTRNLIRAVNFLAFYLLAVLRREINKIWNINKYESRETCVCVCVCVCVWLRGTQTEIRSGIKKWDRKNNTQPALSQDVGPCMVILLRRGFGTLNLTQ